MKTDAWLLISISLGYVLATIARYIRTRRRMATMGDLLLSNLVKDKIQTKTVS